MVTALDTSVILDVVISQQLFSKASLMAIRTASAEGSLVICECVIAEIRPALTQEQIEEFLTDWSLEFKPSSKESALLAGAMQKRYLDRAKRSGRVLPDFLIGAHACCHSDRLLARDRGYYRDYFQGLVVIEPTIDG